MQGLRPYAATVRMSASKHAYFGVAYLIGEYALRAVTLAAMLLLWRSLIGVGADAGGLTLAQAMSYTLMASVLGDMLNVRTSASSWIFDGQISGQLSRPMGIYLQNIAQTVGEWLVPLAVYSVPIALVGAALGVSVVPVSGWFFASLALAVSAGFAVDFLFACLVIRLHQATWVVTVIRNALVGVLSGSLIPFAAFPAGLGNVLELTPLGALAGAPLAIFAGVGNAWRLLTAQVVWNIVLWPLAVYCFNKSRERMVSHGG